MTNHEHQWQFGKGFLDDGQIYMECIICGKKEPEYPQLKEHEMNNSNKTHWKVSGHSTVVDSQTFEEIVRVDTREKARLIATAPEMLRALEEIQLTLNHISPSGTDNLIVLENKSKVINKILSSIISKARGES